MQFHHATLSNGLEVIAELSPSAQSTAFGFFVRAGARDERPEWNGVSHFLEHMVFKGTDRVGALEVNRRFDELGADYNAATGEESTVYYASVLPEYFEESMSLMGSLLNPAIRDDDFATEQQVILEEIGMYDDQPSYVAYDHAMQRHFAGHPLGQTVLGSRATVSGLRPAEMRDYHRERYHAGNVTVAVCGSATWPQVLRLSQELSAAWPAAMAPLPGLIRPSVPATSHWTHGSLRQFQVIDDSLQLQHLLQLAPAPHATHPLRPVAELLSAVLGESSSSRLFWELVDTGLADDAEVSFSEFLDAGAYMVYLCCGPDQYAENSETLARILAEIQREGVNHEELELAKTNLITRLVLRSERPMGRAPTIGHDWLMRREYLSVRDEIAQVQRCTRDDVRRLLDEFPLVPRTSVSVGPAALQAGAEQLQHASAAGPSLT